MGREWTKRGAWGWRGCPAKATLGDVEDLGEKGAIEAAGLQIFTGDEAGTDRYEAEGIAAGAMAPAVPEAFTEIDVEVDAGFAIVIAQKWSLSHLRDAGWMPCPA